MTIAVRDCNVGAGFRGDDVTFWLAILAAAAQSASDRLATISSYDATHDPKAAIVEITALIAAADKRTDPETLALAKSKLADAHYYAQQFDAALAAMAEAEAILTRVGKTEGKAMAEIQNNLGAIHAGMGQAALAQPRLDRALAMREKLFGADSLEYGATIYLQGYVYFSQGDFTRAAAAMGKAVELQAKHGKPGDTEAGARWTSYAAVLDAAGRSDDALAELRKSVAWAERTLPPSHPLIGTSLNNLGAALVNAGRHAEAEGVFRRTLDSWAVAIGRQHPDNAQTMQNLANALGHLGRLEEAEALNLAAFDLITKAKDPRASDSPGEFLLSAADIAASRGDAVAAMERRKRAIDLLAPVVSADHPSLARARSDYADSLRLAGRHAEALPIAVQAATAMRARLAPDHYFRTRAEMVEAVLLHANGQSAKGVEQARTVAGVMAQRLLDPGVSRRELVSVTPRYRTALALHAELALATGHDEEGFRAIQLANLTDVATASVEVAARAAAESPEAAALARSLQDTSRQSKRLRQQYSRALAAGAQAQATRLESEIERLDSEAETALAALDRAFPAFRALSQPTPVTLADYRAGLAQGDALLAPLLLQDGVLAVAVTRDGLVWEKVTGNPNAVIDDAGRIRDSIEAARLADSRPAFDRQAAHRLYRAIAPGRVAAAIGNRGTLRFFGGGNALAALPLGLLVTKAPKGEDTDPAALRRTAWLIRDHAVTVATSLRPVPAPAGTTRPPERFAGFGGPALAAAPEAPIRFASLFRGGAVDVAALRDLPSLPYAARELETMRTAIGGDAPLLRTGSEATESAVKSADLSRYAVIAFATHGLVSGEMAGVGEPGLVFTPPAVPGEEDDGLLSASEISNLRLNADWVILSACNTGSGGGGAAPVYTGLARAFLAAGARALLVSHWAVRDDSAARLTVGTVRNSAAGLSRPEALRRAMLTMIADRSVKDGAHPANWAPFVLIGE